MNFDNPIETIVHHVLIGGINYLSRQDGFLMVSAPIYVMHTGQNRQ